MYSDKDVTEWTAKGAVQIPAGNWKLAINDKMKKVSFSVYIITLQLGGIKLEFYPLFNQMPKGKV